MNAVKLEWCFQEIGFETSSEVLQAFFASARVSICSPHTSRVIRRELFSAEMGSCK